jgi:hypothetical protein
MGGMSNFGPFGGGRNVPRVPTPPRGQCIARYDTYLEAQRAVDFLSDSHFPVQFVTIVGTDLRMVERVTGRLTYGRVALAGSLSGAWFGLFVGLLLSLFGGTSGSGFPLFAAILIGAAFGMLFGVISYAFTGGRRDFTSTSQIVASEYQVLCADEQAHAASQLLDRLPGGAGRGPGPGPGAGATVAPLPPVERPTPQDAPAPVHVSGPTYGEMIDKQRREREDRERAERKNDERERAAREAAAGKEPPAPVEGGSGQTDRTEG